MKRTQLTDLLTTIHATAVSFFSIMMFVALAVAVFLGIDWSGKALEAATENTFNETKFHDAMILFPYGLTSADIEQLCKVEGVSDAEGGQVGFGTAVYQNNEYSMRVGSLDTKIDTPVLIEGTLPVAANEMAVEARWAWRHDVELGDTIELSDNNPDNGAISQSVFTITALVEHPGYISNSTNTWGASSSRTGSIDVLGWIPLESFNMEFFSNAFTQVTVRSDALRQWPTLSDSYKTASSELKDRITQLGDQLAVTRKDDYLQEGRDLVANAEQQLSDAEAQLADAEKQLADGERQLAEGEQELADGKRQLDEKKAEYEQAKKDGKAQLDEALTKLNEGQKSYDDALSEFNSKIAEYNTAVEELRADEAKLDPNLPGYVDAIKVVDAKWEKIAEAGDSLETARTELDSKRVELENAWQSYHEGENSYAQQIAEAEQAIAEAEQQLADGQKQLDDGRRELEEKKTEFADAQATIDEKSLELDDAKKQLSALEESRYSWTVLSRAENGGVISMASFVDIAGRLRSSMASLFVLVGLFVCYAAIARLVREQQRQIGTKKALGIRANEVTVSFLLYANFSVVQGPIIGVAAAVLVVERIIIPVLSSSFFAPTPAYWSPVAAVAFGVFELILITLSTMLACHSVLKKNAVELLAGEAPPTSKERFFESWDIWKRLPLYTQTTINNLLNDRRRVMSTLVGVAGCTALVVCAITLNDDVIAGVGRQYVDVYHYDAVIATNVDEADALTRAAQAASDMGCLDYANVATRVVALSLPDNTIFNATITVPEDNESFARLVTLTSIMGDTKGEEVHPGADGAWVSSAYADHYGVKPGDVINVVLGDGFTYEIPIAGFFKHYLVGHQIIMSPELYQSIFDVEPTISKLLVRTGADVSADELKEELVDASFVTSVANDREDQETLFNSFRKVSRVVVLVYLALSIAMAVVVLLNLNVMFVEEKRRDLITLMVCGYTVKDAKGYIWRDNLVLTILGILIGMLLGMAAGYFAVLSVEISTVTLVKEPAVRACIAGAISSAALSTIMTLISLYRIPRLKLSDITRL